MARPLRIDIPDGWYHLTGRGIDRRSIYTDERERMHFLELLAGLPERFGIRVHAYVLMPNHYHLLVQTPRANASAAMQWLSTSYAMWFNRRHERVGPLFQGRFKSIHVDGEGAWALELSAYLHLNPVRVRALGLDKAQRKVQAKGWGQAPSGAATTRRLEILRGYRWSSYPAYAGYAPVPDWLTTEELWRRGAGRKRRQPDAYRRYVESRVRQGSEETPRESLVADLAVGGRGFIERLKRMAKGDRREQKAARALQEAVPFEKVVAAVERVKGERLDAFVARHGDTGRDVLLWVARSQCGLTLKELGQRVRGLDYGAASQAIRRLRRRLARDRSLREVVSRVKAELSLV